MSDPLVMSATHGANTSVYATSVGAEILIPKSITASHTLTGEAPQIAGQPAQMPALDRRNVLAVLRQAGLLDDQAEGEPKTDTPEEAAARESLAQRLGQGAPLSQMVIEGREQG
jgi:hypothetical protein